MFSCSPVGTLRSTKNWVHIPLKEISDANKLFCARCSGYRVAPKTKLWVTSLTSTKFVFLLTGRHRARRGWLSRFSVDFWTGAARNRKKRGHRGRTSGAAMRLSEEPLNNWARKSVSCLLFFIITSMHCLLLFLSVGVTYIEISDMDTLCCGYLCITGRATLSNMKKWSTFIRAVVTSAMKCVLHGCNSNLLHKNTCFNWCLWHVSTLQFKLESEKTSHYWLSTC